MPALSNTRHEAFAQALAKGMTRDEAYETAGYAPNRQNAYRLITNDDVRTRVEELQGRAAEKAEWTAADRLKMLAEIAATGMDEDDPRIVISAIAEANKMQGSYAPAKLDHQSSDGSMTPQIITRRIIDPKDSDGT